MAASSHSRIRSLDIPIIDKVFDMQGGYVLNFTNLTFAEFFRGELGVDIDQPCWAVQGGSKAKRLRCFLRQADGQTALDTLNALWEYREASSITADYPELDDSVLTAYYRIIERLGGNPPEPVLPTATHREPRIDEAATSALASRLVEVSKLDPQPRGYAFEKFLKDVFDAFGLSARASFRLTGEQIDGSFILGEQTYLLEARWRNEKVNVETLRAFNAKVEDKASWSRGLIISQSGFTTEGLEAFGRGKSVVCMDGLDLHEVLSGRLDLAEVIALKVRRAAENRRGFRSRRRSKCIAGRVKLPFERGAWCDEGQKKDLGAIPDLSCLELVTIKLKVTTKSLNLL